MPVERSAGIIFYREDKGARRYLVIRSSYHGKDGKHNFWDFPKGLLESKESGLEAAEREAKEEVGIKEFDFIPDFKETVKYFVRRDRDEKATLKFVALFLAKTQEDKVALSWEHDAHEWLPPEEAKERLSLLPMKEALKRAEEFLRDKR